MKIALRIFILLILAGLVYFFFFIGRSLDRSRNSTEWSGIPEIPDASSKLHSSLIIADWHADPLLWDRDLMKRIDYGQTDIPRFIEGNVTLQVFGVVTKSPSGQNYDSNEANTFDNITPLAIANRWPVKTWFSLYQRALYQAERLHHTSERSNGQLIVITEKKELAELIRNREMDKNRMGGILSMEGTHALEGDINKFDQLYDAGFRIFGITHFFDNEAGGSSAGMQKGGLSDFGFALIRRIDERSCILDLAHASPNLIDDILRTNERPVIVSHTGVQGIVNSPRNLSDDHIIRIAEKGGLIGVGFWDEAVGDISPEGIVRTIRYIRDLVGAEHISLGSDYDGSVHSYFDVAGLSLLTDALLADGFTEEEIRLIMGENQVNFLMAYLP
jgi:microsomal dipeptidase-like Zn-dependent dipeptidase